MILTYFASVFSILLLAYRINENFTFIHSYTDALMLHTCHDLHLVIRNITLVKNRHNFFVHKKSQEYAAK